MNESQSKVLEATRSPVSKATPRELLAAATPPYRTRGGKGYTDVLDRNGECIASIVPVEDADLIVAAVSEYPVLLDIAEAALRSTTDDRQELAGSVEHPQTCALWVELDDVTGAVHPVGTCDCGLADLRDALARLVEIRSGELLTQATPSPPASASDSDSGSPS